MFKSGNVWGRKKPDYFARAEIYMSVRECSMNEKGCHMSNRPSLEFYWTQTKPTIHVHVHAHVAMGLVNGINKRLHMETKSLVIEFNTG